MRMWPGFRLPQAVAIAEYGAMVPGWLHGVRGAYWVREWMLCWFRKSETLCRRAGCWLVRCSIARCRQCSGGVDTVRLLCAESVAFLC